jgi:heme-degrading monooxygenase HmoA
MIARLWHGRTTKANADKYETLLRSEVLPGIHRVKGYHGAYLLRREMSDQVEFVTITYFDSWDAVGDFAGPDRERAVVPPAAQALLLSFDQRAVHYEVLAQPD